MRRQADAAGEPPRPCSPSRVVRQSRRRMERDVDQFIADDYRQLWFITLTFPGSPTLEEATARFAKLGRLMRREFGDQPGWWKRELHASGVVHIHLLYRLSKPRPVLEEWLRTKWYPAYRLEIDSGPVTVTPAHEGVKKYLLKESDHALPDTAHKYGRWGTATHISTNVE